VLKPCFVDIILLAFLLGLTGKGYVTGFIRSAVTAVAAFGAYVLAAAMPTIAAVGIHYLLPPSSPNYMVVNQLVAYGIFFAGLQGIGFLLTGLFENIGLGGIDKFAGCLLGVATGIFIGMQPGIAILSHPVAARYPANQRYFTQTLLLKAYAPLIKGFARGARRPG
jgi:uncharacterized membrane protein required for colicin V production